MGRSVRIGEIRVGIAIACMAVACGGSAPNQGGGTAGKSPSAPGGAGAGGRAGGGGQAGGGGSPAAAGSGAPASGNCMSGELLFEGLPKLKAGFAGEVRNIVVDAENVYFNAGGKAAIYRVPLAGGTPVAIDLGTAGEPEQFWLYRGQFLLHFTTGPDARLATMPLAGGPVTTLLPLAATALRVLDAGRRLRLEGDLLYGSGTTYNGLEVNDDLPQLYAIDLVKPGITVVHQVTGRVMSQNVAKSADRFFFAMGAEGVRTDLHLRLYSIPLAGGTPTEMFPELDAYPTVTTDAHLYFEARPAESKSDAAFSPYRVALTGGAPEPLPADIEGGLYASSIEGHVLLRRASSGLRMSWVPRDGGMPVYVGCSPNAIYATYPAAATNGKSVFLNYSHSKNNVVSVERFALP